MAGFSGRSGSRNVSQFLREVNENPTSLDDGPPFTALDEHDMSVFTNTHFFDYDTGQNTDFQPQPTKTDGDGRPSLAADDDTMGEFSPLELMAGEYGFADFGSTYASPTMSSFPDSLSNLQPIQPNLQGVYHGIPPPPHQAGGYGAPPSTRLGGEKRKPESLSPDAPSSLEEQGRRAAEEDKRRRNTAASARFRVKKKQREQALEKSAKEMTEKVTALEGRIQQLETENKWLKNIVVEKNGGSEELVAKLLEEVNSKHQALLKKEAEEVSNLKAPTSPEEREAADSSG